MSLILEALRKSEAERRRGSTPDVAMELPPPSTAKTRTMPAWLLPAALLIAIAALFAWWWSWRDTDDAALAPATNATSVAGPHVDQPTQPVVVARPAPAAPPIAAPQTMPSAPLAAQPAVTAPVQPPVLPPPTRPLPSPSMPAVDTRDVADIDATSLPPVKLSMHMWDESPSRRFVILDGQRMAEGDRNGEVTVVSIERDGVIVERNGQRARVPLP